MFFRTIFFLVIIFGSCFLVIMIWFYSLCYFLLLFFDVIFWLQIWFKLWLLSNQPYNGKLFTWKILWNKFFTFWKTHLHLFNKKWTRDVEWRFVNDYYCLFLCNVHYYDVIILNFCKIKNPKPRASHRCCSCKMENPSYRNKIIKIFFEK